MDLQFQEPGSSREQEQQAGEGADNFRARRLSLAKGNVPGGSSSDSISSPANPAARRQRRLSMSPEMGAKAVAAPFPPEVVGTYSCHGVEPGRSAGEMMAKINQDRGCVCYPFGVEGEKTSALFCVFDGHGVCGDKVSHYAMHGMQAKLEQHPLLASDPKTALEQVFIAIDTELQTDSSIDAELSGTTAVVALARWTQGGRGKVWVANVGDSRAVMAVQKGGKLKAVALSEDQKPDTPAEQKRIEKAGGFVSPPEEEWGGPARVWLDANMTLPGLAMARSIGDHLVGGKGVIAKPEVKEVDIDPAANMAAEGPQLLVMASDGVWEFIDSQEAVDILQANNARASATEAVTKLIETAAHQWRKEEGDYRDDITAVCINLVELFKRGDD
uniref:PPM-type phosphatase domain-containing protein n=1 Tax=Emiliania huxleyi TaxID=2903 RepID=A0A6U8RHK7_EMIHU|mmetsp:Transcript_13939/g.41109  ORF Transcript_13939/g.41109 Transcript_13939/m.41109 type:complete len:387 (+) Transcript_13939:116-1276(+)